MIPTFPGQNQPFMQPAAQTAHHQQQHPAPPIMQPQQQQQQQQQPPPGFMPSFPNAGAARPANNVFTPQAPHSSAALPPPPRPPQQQQQQQIFDPRGPSLPPPPAPQQQGSGGPGQAHMQQQQDQQQHGMGQTRPSMSQDPYASKYASLDDTFGGPPVVYQPGQTMKQMQSTGHWSTPAQQAPTSVKDRPSPVPEGVVPCHPKFLSLSCNALPNSQALRQKSGLPFGIVLQPLANNPTGQALPVVNFGESGVVRCQSCRAYINPYVEFADSGHRWRCNLCGLQNDVPRGYYSALDTNGRRVDFNERPELSHSSVEIVAPVEYMVRQPMPPVYVFLVDVSVNAVQSGMLATFAQTIKEALDALPGGTRTHVAFLTFDSSVHYYCLKPDASNFAMYCMSDLEDIFLPRPRDLLVNLQEMREQVDTLLDSLPSMHEKTTNVENCLGPAVHGAMKLMTRFGGKLQVFACNLPSLGAGRLPNRDHSKALGTDQEHLLLTPNGSFYRKTAVNMTRYQISVDLYLFAFPYVDVATVSELAHFTGGQVFYYPSFQQATHGQQLCDEVKHVLCRPTGWEAVVRVRATKGMDPRNFHGNFHLRGTDLLALPSIDSDKAFAATLANSEGIIGVQNICIQAALLYTTSFGERRIRVHTTIVPVTSMLSDLYAYVDINTTTALLAKDAVKHVLQHGLKKARDRLGGQCVSMCRAHRAVVQQAANDAAQNQQPAPELTPQDQAMMATAPLMVLGLIKHTAFRSGADVLPDVRAAALSAMRSSGVSDIETYVRPRMIPMHVLDGGVGLKDEATGVVTLPAETNLSMSALSSEGAFLIDNGREFVLRLGRATPAVWVKSVFGVDSLDSVDIGSLVPLQPAEADSDSVLRRFCNVLEYLRVLSQFHQRLFCVKEGSPEEVIFFNMLIEDRTMSAMSLTEFTDHIGGAQQQQQYHPQQQQQQYRAQ